MNILIQSAVLSALRITRVMAFGYLGRASDESASSPIDSIVYIYRFVVFGIGKEYY